LAGEMVKPTEHEEFSRETVRSGSHFSRPQLLQFAHFLALGL
jgi:hypothetical protein